MEKIYSILLTICFGFLSLNGQQVFFIQDAVEINNEGIGIMPATNYMYNGTSKSLTLQWVKTDTELPDGWETQICTVESGDMTGGICYQSDVYTNPFTIGSGDTLGFKVNFVTPGIPDDPATGIAELELFFYDPLDSMNVNGTSGFRAVTVSTGFSDLTVNDASFRTFPNPVISTVNVQLQNYSDVKFIEVYNLVGQKVVSHTVEDQRSIQVIDMMDMDEGLFFISLLDQGENILETKRFSKVR